VAAVSAHTGARYEAAERDLLPQWRRVPTPSPADLAVITTVDLVTGPTANR
jgi:hypothetical protein